MPDDYETPLINALCCICAEDEYKVTDAEELFSVLPSLSEGGEEKLTSAIKGLARDGYIILRYVKNGEFCLAVTQKSRIFLANLNIDGKRKTVLNDLRVIIPLAFAVNFLASLASILVLKLLGAIC